MKSCRSWNNMAATTKLHGLQLMTHQVIKLYRINTQLPLENVQCLPCSRIGKDYVTSKTEKLREHSSAHFVKSLHILCFTSYFLLYILVIKILRLSYIFLLGGATISIKVMRMMKEKTAGQINSIHNYWKQTHFW